MAKVINIPKELTKKGELVLIPRKEYESFLHWQKSIKKFRPTASQKKALEKARKDFSRGRYITLKELKNELEGSSSS